jgi:aspartate carbamoyltransferase catalytic subunit
MSLVADEFATIPAAWTRRHLLDLESLSAEEIQLILDTAEQFKESTGGCKNKISVLSGKTLANLFFENSTQPIAPSSLARSLQSLCASAKRS